jgi:protein TonB
VRGSLPISAAGHAAIIGLLLLLPAAMPSRPKLDLTNAVDVVFAPPPPVQPPAPAPPPPPPPQPVVEEPPPPPPVVEQPPPPPAAQAEMPPPPPPKPMVKPRPRPPQPAVERQPEMPLPLPAPTPAPVAAPSPQVASLPAAPVITSDYRSLLSGWLESHKHYPEEARQRGEEGRAVLRFRVDRMGRVLNYSVVNSTGFADLDAAIDNMMRGASLPPFPPSMAEPEIEVSVTIRYGLSH